MYSESELGEQAQEQETASRECPLCRSALIPEAVEAGKCQCCGHDLRNADT